MKVKGINTTVTIKTLNEDFKQSTRAIEGWKVSFAAGKNEWISLPRMFSQNELPGEWWLRCSTTDWSQLVKGPWATRRNSK